MIVEAESCDCSGGGVFCGGGGVLQWSDTIFSSFSFPLLWLLIIDQVIGVCTACFLEVCSDGVFFFSLPAVGKVRRSECDKDHRTRQESKVSG